MRIRSQVICFAFAYLLSIFYSSIFVKCLFFFFFERERETECEQGRGRERGRHRIQSRHQALSCQHRARCRAWTHEPGDHDLRWSWTVNRLSHPGAPIILEEMLRPSLLGHTMAACTQLQFNLLCPRLHCQAPSPSGLAPHNESAVNRNCKFE